MSSARRLQEDYRRIIGLQDETRGLDDDLPRMRIGGQRGVWQIGNNELKTGSAGGEDEDGNEEEPVTPDEDDRNENADGSGTGGQNTDSDGTEVVDPEDPPAGVDVDSDTFGGDWASGGLKSFVDCETNQCIELIEVGGYVPPDGWDDADNGPLPDGYEHGYYWTGDGGSVADQSPSGVASKVDNPFTPICAKRDPRGVDGWALFDTAPLGDGPCWRYLGPNSLRRRSCSDNYHPVCDLPPPIPEYWPSDNCIQLAPNSEGNWQASQYENPDDMTAKYSEAKSILNVCNSSGEPIDIYQRVGGGFVYFNQTQGIWAGSDSSGRMRSFGSSSTLNQEIARPRN